MIKNIGLLNFDIEITGLSRKIKWLKNKAIEQVCKNPLLFVDEHQLKTRSLVNFFKLAIIRKEYLNDYLFLVKNIFGIKVNDNVLTSSPCEFIKQDFIIKYNYNGQEYAVNFSFTGCDKVKLSYVGHKIGMTDNFVFNLENT